MSLEALAGMAFKCNIYIWLVVYSLLFNFSKDVCSQTTVAGEVGESGSGEFDTTTSSVTSEGSGFESTITLETTAASTTISIFDGSGSTVDATTSTIDETTFTVTQMIKGSGETTTFQQNDDPTTVSTISVTALSETSTVSNSTIFEVSTAANTTVFEVSTASNTTVFEVSTASGTTVFEVSTNNDTDTFSTADNTTIFMVTTAPVLGDAGFPWYYIVIIILSILLLIVVIAFILYCCMKKKSDKKALKIDAATGVTSPMQTAAAQPVATSAYVPSAQTVLPPEVDEEPVVSFVSSSPMHEPLLTQKRTKAAPRLEPKSSSYDDDEGFNEPSTRKNMSRNRGKRQTSDEQKQDSMSGSELEPHETGVSHQPFYLPTPIQTALTGKALGSQLTDSALAAQNELQRSDIERHRMKQRLRRKRTEQQQDSLKDPQKTIDSVLEPPPPVALQGYRERRRLQKHGLLDRYGKPIRESPQKRKIPTHKERHSSETSTENSSSEKRPAHEAVISKMTKLLEDAYALLAPAVQKTPIQLLPGETNDSDPASQNLLYPQLMAGQHRLPDERLFTRTHTPPALLPQASQPPRKSGPMKANDARSAVWTPYRAFDQFQELQYTDPSLFQSPRTSNQDILLPMQPRYTSSVNLNVPTPSAFSSPYGVENPIMPRSSFTPLPGHAQPEFIGMDTLATMPNTADPQPSVPDRNFVDRGTEEPAASIVQSIKDTLAELAGKSTSDSKNNESVC